MASEIVRSEHDSMHRQRPVSRFAIAWLDPSADALHDNQHPLMTHLQCMISPIRNFSNVDQCIDYLTEVESGRIILIVSNRDDFQLLYFTDHLPQLDCIYALADGTLEMHQWKKTPRILRNFDDLAKDLIKDMREYHPDLLPISILSRTDILKQDVNVLPPEFLYSQILKEISFDLAYNANAMEDLVHYWYEHYADNEPLLKIINDFEQKYTPESAIHWYTRENFVYEMLNRGLRIMDVDVMMKMSFFIRDLHRRLEQLYHQQPTDRTVFTVYRGQRISNEDLSKLRRSEGGLLSFNSFVSTSRNQTVPNMFSDAGGMSNVTGVLFEMNIDTHHTRVPFASLDSESQYPDEEEVLFSMHSVFRIDQVTENQNEGRWHVKLTLTCDDDEQLRILTDCLRTETVGHTGWHRLGQLMIRMGKWAKADEVYRTLLASAPPTNAVDLALFNNQLGYIWMDCGDYEKSLAFYHKSLEITQENFPADYLDMAKSYNSIGSVEQAKGNHLQALLFFQKALQVHQMSPISINRDLATIHNNIGQTHAHMGNFPMASASFSRALDLGRDSFPPNHPTHAPLQSNLARLADHQGNYQQALKYYEEALKIQKRSLPATHSDLAQTYNNIGGMHGENGTLL